MDLSKFSKLLELAEKGNTGALSILEKMERKLDKITKEDTLFPVIIEGIAQILSGKEIPADGYRIPPLMVKVREDGLLVVERFKKVGGDGKRGRKSTPENEALRHRGALLLIAGKSYKEIQDALDLKTTGTISGWMQKFSNGVAGFKAHYGTDWKPEASAAPDAAPAPAPAPKPAPKPAKK